MFIWIIQRWKWNHLTLIFEIKDLVGISRDSASFQIFLGREKHFFATNLLVNPQSLILEWQTLFPFERRFCRSRYCFHLWISKSVANSCLILYIFYCFFVTSIGWRRLIARFFFSVLFLQTRRCISVSVTTYFNIQVRRKFEYLRNFVRKPNLRNWYFCATP